MRIDPENVGGLRAAVARKLFRRETFDTMQAMADTDLPEPAITEVLKALADHGWIGWTGCHDGIDWWKSRSLGDRLAATRLIKRFSIDIGQKVLGATVEKARRLNTEPGRSHRIAAIYVFGSVLTGSDDGTAGDVDVVVETVRRDLPKAQIKALQREELRGRENLDFMQRLLMPRRLLLRDLRSVSNKLSFHDTFDLRLPGVTFRQVYAFDPGRDREVPFDPAIQRHSDPINRDDPRSDDLKAYPARPFRPWPFAPTRSPAITIEAEEARKAQHLWQNGLAIVEIGSRIGMRPGEAQTYLASIAHRPTAPDLTFDASLSAMITRALPQNRSAIIHAHVGIGRHGSFDVEVTAHAPRSLQRIGRLVVTRKNDPFLHQAQHDVIGLLETAAEACRIWRDKMTRRVGSLHLRASTFVFPSTTPCAGGNAPIDFRPLEAPMRAALESLWAAPLGSGRSIRIEMDFDVSPIARISIQRGSWYSQATGPGTKVPEGLTAPIRAAAHPVRKRWRTALESGVHHTVVLCGDLLEDPDSLESMQMEPEAEDV